ncbi:envelope stress response membrane protein PspC [Altericroceibacterium xinjiangense]|uniref:envelope stress response membrane protein PspC n=1 Tax=Altericroceibacterium xinjiangense TaxID=762261 RepID=UPI000F7F9E88|nr:envelope stress response membrane protein PspC [Altericroceibacterium xinjiangense]
MSSARTKFYRDKQNGKLMGVCAGLSDYTGIDALWWRLFFLILTFGFGFGLPVYLALGIMTEKKPPHLYVDAQEQKYWQRVRQSPTRTAREVRSRFREIDRRLAEVESHYVSSNPRLSAEIERLR